MGHPFMERLEREAESALKPDELTDALRDRLLALLSSGHVVVSLAKQSDGAIVVTLRKEPGR